LSRATHDGSPYDGCRIPNAAPPADNSQPVKNAPSQKWRAYQGTYDAAAHDRTAKIQALADGGFDTSAR
jgi:hypothetical protein